MSESRLVPTTASSFSVAVAPLGPIRYSLGSRTVPSPWVSAIAGRHHAEIGGFALAPGGKRVVVVATLDNLLKGAATQAMQNLNLAFGFDELTAIPEPSPGWKPGPGDS